MDPDRKRKIRLVVALAVAVLPGRRARLRLVLGLERGEDALGARSGDVGRAYQLAGSVDEIIGGAPTATGAVRSPIATTRARRGAPVAYTGERADAFREGREIVVDGLDENGVFVGDKDTLLTKCPSKFSEEAADDTNVIIE